MAKNNDPMRVKLIANPGAKEVLAEEAQIEQVRCYLDVAAEGIILGNGTARIKVLRNALRRMIAPEPGTGTEEPRADIS